MPPSSPRPIHVQFQFHVNSTATIFSASPHVTATIVSPALPTSKNCPLGRQPRATSHPDHQREEGRSASAALSTMGQCRPSKPSDASSAYEDKDVVLGLANRRSSASKDGQTLVVVPARRRVSAAAVRAKTPRFPTPTT